MLALLFALVRQVFAGNEVADESDVTEPQALWLTMCGWCTRQVMRIPC